MLYLSLSLPLSQYQTQSMFLTVTLTNSSPFLVPVPEQSLLMSPSFSPSLFMFFSQFLFFPYSVSVPCLYPCTLPCPCPDPCTCLFHCPCPCPCSFPSTVPCQTQYRTYPMHRTSPNLFSVLFSVFVHTLVLLLVLDHVPVVVADTSQLLSLSPIMTLSQSHFAKSLSLFVSLSLSPSLSQSLSQFLSLSPFPVPDRILIPVTGSVPFPDPVPVPFPALSPSLSRARCLKLERWKSRG
jgi:hypothetical protein